MRTRIALLAISALSLAGLVAAPASQAAGTFCYSAQVVVNGSDAVNQAGCQDLPV